MKGCVCLVGWPIADGLPTEMVTRKLQLNHKVEKVRRPKIDVLPLCHATNQITKLQERSLRCYNVTYAADEKHYIAK